MQLEKAASLKKMQITCDLVGHCCLCDVETNGTTNYFACSVGALQNKPHEVQYGKTIYY